MPYKNKADHVANNKRWRHANPAKVRATKKRRRKKLRADLQSVIDAAKADGCTRCSFFHPAVLQFHHRDPTSKAFMISGCHKAAMTVDRLREEIAKCDVLCANCHFILHYEERLAEEPAREVLAA